jgi:hypothetical protein
MSLLQNDRRLVMEEKETVEQTELEPIGDRLFEPLEDADLEQVSGGTEELVSGDGSFGASNTGIGQSAAFDSDRTD